MSIIDWVKYGFQALTHHYKIVSKDHVGSVDIVWPKWKPHAKEFHVHVMTDTEDNTGFCLDMIETDELVALLEEMDDMIDGIDLRNYVNDHFAFV